MSGFEIGQTVRVCGERMNGSNGSVVSWDDTRSQYLVDLGDEQPHYFDGGELEAASS